ncbi:MAG: precorrin-3B C(17)-methyltransferase, partial [Propionivibrio sp.]
VALYNPKSGKRTRQIQEAQRIFLRHRDPQTPVAVVKSAFRAKQRVEFTTLEKLLDADIGMLTTVLIGNSNTFVKHGLMITPRGYANKYDVEIGNGSGNSAARDGEKAGHSLSSGLNGWLAAIHASGRSPAELARIYRLPEDYIAAVLSQPLDIDEDDSSDVSE